MPVITGKMLKRIYREIASLPAGLREDKEIVEEMIYGLVDLELGNVYTMEEVERRMRWKFRKLE